MSDPISEILPFLEEGYERLDVKMMTVKQILGLTASKEGLGLLQPHMERLLSYLVKMLGGKSEVLAKDSSGALINITASKELALQCVRRLPEFFVADLWHIIEDENSVIADPACMILCNLSNSKASCDLVMENFQKAGIDLDKIVGVFCMQNYNKKGASLNYIGPFLSNLTQLPEARLQLLNRENPAIDRLLPFTEHTNNIRKGGVVGTLKNCCFDPKFHDWLLDESGINILPRLLLPLAGPSPEDLEDEEMNKLPVELQYLDDDKKVESDPDIKQILLEALLQLCATKTGREYIRSKNAYFILRELHKSEKDETLVLACENVVDILIKKETEIGFDSYHEVEIPNDVQSELEKVDEDFLKKGTDGSPS